MLKNNYFEIEKDLDEGFLRFIDYGKAENFSFEKRNKVYQDTKNEKIQYIGLQADGKVNPIYYRLATVAEHFKIKFKGHRALSDALVTAKIFLRLSKLEEKQEKR